MRRDFSEATVARLYATIDSIKHDGQWGIVDFFTDVFATVPDLSDVQAYQRAVLDKYNVSESDLDGILRTVGTVDASTELQVIGYANVADEFAQRIRNLADMITPVVISSPVDVFADIGHRVAVNYADTRRGVDGFTADERGAVDQGLDEREPWWEKLVNGVGGFAYGVVDSAVFGGLEGIESGIDMVFGSHLADSVASGREAVGQWVDGHWVTNQQWFFGGQAVGDGAVCVAGVVVTVLGVATIAGSVTLTAGGVVASATGVGAIVGVPAIAVSWAGVAAGTAEVAGGLAMMAGGASSAGDNWAESHRYGERNPGYDDASWAESIAEHIGGRRLDGVTPGNEADYIDAVMNGDVHSAESMVVSASGRTIYRDGTNIIIKDPTSPHGGTAYSKSTVEAARADFDRLTAGHQ